MEQLSLKHLSSPLVLRHLTISRFIGGPLDGITDSPFRRLMRRYCTQSLLYSEMRHVSSVAHDKTGERTLRFLPLERPLNYQIAANTVRDIEPAIAKIIAAGVDAIDLNCGCPAKNVIRSGSGSALMADLPRMREIVTLLRRLIPGIFTVKIRAGFKEKNAVVVAQLLQDLGVDAIALHPRTQTQQFAGQPDYAIAAAVRQAVTIPVFFSGGVVNYQTAAIVYQKTGIDAFLIGRGIWARPWKLLEMQAHAAGEPYAITHSAVLAAALEHFDLMLAYYGEHGLYNFRKHLPFYLRGLAGAAQLRAALVTAEDERYIRQALQHAYEQSKE
ncbi:tRNA-dihydrouridine synthase [Candidatus Dependentiae bacterium]|nr:tRNA-dihydrouridine synthase [Candidatus Dependentiae bacterium]